MKYIIFVILMSAFFWVGCSSTATEPILPAQLPEDITYPIAGISDHKLEQQVRTNLVSQANASWVRLELNWSLVEPVEGQRVWASVATLEEQLINAFQNQLEVILIVRGTPPWAQAIPGSTCGPIQPGKYEAFARFMNDLVARYHTSPFMVKYWEIWNEPDIDPNNVPADSGFGCWGNPQDPNFGGAAYGQLLRTIRPQVRAADPDAQILIGGLLLDCDPRNPPENKDCRGSRFLDGVLEAAGGRFIRWHQLSRL